jgi:MbtH protein
MTKANWSIDGEEFKILINDEGQYSLWPSAVSVPLGWQETGPVGSKDVCLEFVQENWTDMRPESLRKVMDAR